MRDTTYLKEDIATLIYGKLEPGRAGRLEAEMLAEQIVALPEIAESLWLPINPTKHRAADHPAPLGDRK